MRHPHPSLPLSTHLAVGTVFVDQAYWQSAIAAKPSATYKGYLLGGLCWCVGGNGPGGAAGGARGAGTAWSGGHGLHWAPPPDSGPRLPSCACGPASNPCLPAHPHPHSTLYNRFAVPFSMATFMGLGARAMNLPITIAESNSGLVPPAVATMLMGGGGAFLLVFQLWMAVTASGSAEQIAVSSLISYDVYR
jgi:hypothetical protein